MSLSAQLASQLRPKLPSAVLDACVPADKIVVENILYCLQELIPEVNLLQTIILRNRGVYTITVPLAQSSYEISLQTLRTLQNYSPARVDNIFIDLPFKEKPGNIKLIVADETKPLSVSELDIIRLSKRSRH